MRVVLDTNVLISAVLSLNGPPYQLIQRRHRGDFELVTSELLLEEYRRVLGYAHVRSAHGLDDAALDRRKEEMRRVSTVVAPTARLDVVERDESDNRFVECAVAGDADFIVSGDRHLLSVVEYQGVRVLRPSAFIAYLDSLGTESG